MLTPLMLEIARDLAAGWGAGLLIGLERSYNGRAAGLRTHALVGLAAAGVAVLALQPLLSGGQRFDPYPLAQGVMTGIGFLGAGVIFKEGVSVQGLTTAASIWATAAVGLLFGSGLFYPGMGVTALILVTLTVFRWIEWAIPWRVYALGVFRFEADKAPDQAGLAGVLGLHSVRLSEVSYKLAEGGAIFEYSTNLETRRQDGFVRLIEHLRTLPGLVEYEVSRINK